MDSEEEAYCLLSVFIPFPVSPIFHLRLYLPALNTERLLLSYLSHPDIPSLEVVEPLSRKSHGQGGKGIAFIVLNCCLVTCK